MKTSHSGGKPFIIVSQAAKVTYLGKPVLHAPATAQQDKAPIGLWMFDGFQAEAVLFGGVGSYIAGVALVDESDLDCLPGSVLHDLSPVMLISCCNQECQQISQRINRHLYFAAIALLGSIVSSMFVTFGRRLYGPAAIFGSTDLSPARLGLLIDDIGQQAVPRQPPGGSGSHYAAQRIIQFSQVIVRLPSIFRQQAQLSCNELPLVVRYIIGIRFSGHETTTLPCIVY